MLNTKVALREQSIVRRAQQAQIFRTSVAASGPWILVMDLKKRTSRAPAAIFADECTTQVIALHDRSINVNTIGNCRAMRAAVIRWNASLSLNPSRFTQYSNSEGLPSRR